MTYLDDSGWIYMMSGQHWPQIQGEHWDVFRNLGSTGI